MLIGLNGKGIDICWVKMRSFRGRVLSIFGMMFDDTEEMSILIFESLDDLFVGLNSFFLLSDVLIQRVDFGFGHVNLSGRVETRLRVVQRASAFRICVFSQQFLRTIATTMVIVGDENFSFCVRVYFGVLILEF